MESTSRNEFIRSFRIFSQRSVQKSGQCHKRHYKQRFTLKNSRSRRGKQRSDMKIKGKLMSILRLGWTTLKTSWCKKMRIYKTSLKLTSFIHIMLRKNVLHSRQKGNIWEFLTAAWSFFGIKKKLSTSQEKITGYCQEFKGKSTI